jgi:hypothetical protein
MSLTTGKLLDQCAWTALPMHGEVIERMHALAGQNPADGAVLFGWQDGTEIINEADNEDNLHDCDYDPDDDDADDDDKEDGDPDDDDDHHVHTMAKPLPLLLPQEWTTLLIAKTATAMTTASTTRATVAVVSASLVKARMTLRPMMPRQMTVMHRTTSQTMTTVSQQESPQEWQRQERQQEECPQEWQRQEGCKKEWQQRPQPRKRSNEQGRGLRSLCGLVQR